MDNTGQSLNKKQIAVLQCPHGHTMTVHTADGLFIRNHMDVGFSNGTHDLADKGHVAGKNEIVLDQMNHPQDLAAFAHHEMTEHIKMAHEGYDEAHHEANAAESKFRQQKFGVPAPHLDDGDL